MLNSVSYHGRDLEVLAEMPKYYDWILDHFRTHVSGAVIEFGAGTGTISSRLRPHVETLDLVEPSPNLVEHLLSRFDGDAKVTVFCQSLEHRLSETEPGKHDSIVAVNLLEHLEDDSSAMKGFFDLLTPGGKACLFVPALPTLMSRLDHEFGHFRRYTRQSLGRLAESVGFRLVEIRYMDFLGIVPWFVLFRLGKSVSFNARAVRLYDSVGIPFTRTMERLLKPRIGKNLILIAEKPAI